MFSFILGTLLCMSSPAAHAAGSSAAASSPLVGVDLLTFNTWGLPAPIARSRSARFPRIQRFLERAQDDVIGLQEVWRGARRLLSLRGLRFPGGDGDSGLAVLSRLPVEATRSLTYRAASGIDRLKDKGALLATVDHPDAGRLHVVTTHLQAGRGGGAQAARAAQIDELLALSGGLSGPVVLMGDFNLYGDLDVDRDAAGRLADAGFVDVAAALGVTSPTHASEAARLDRVFIRGGQPLAAEVLDPRGLSDHRPLQVRVGLPAGAR